MHHIPLRGLQEALPFPHIIRNMVPAHPQVQRLFRNPEIREQLELIFLIQGREYQDKRRDVRGGGKIQAAVADAPFQFLFVHSKSALIPFLHRHPAHRLLHPLVQPQLPEGILLPRILLRRLAGRFHLVHPHRDVQGWIGLLPYLRISPVVTLIRPVNHRVKGRIDLPAFQDVLRLLVRLIADGVGIRPCCGDQEIQRLHPGIAGTFCHNIEQLPVRLGMQLIKDHSVDIKSMFAVCLRGQYLIKTVGRLINDPLLGSQDLYPPVQRRAHPHHIRRHLKNNGGLLSVSGTAIHFRAFLPIAAAEQKGYRCSQFGFPLLLRDLNVRGIKLPVSIRLQNSEQIPDDLLLPVDQFKRLSRPSPLRMTETLDEVHGKIRRLLVVNRILRLELCRLIFLQFPHLHPHHRLSATAGTPARRFSPSSPAEHSCRRYTGHSGP